MDINDGKYADLPASTIDMVNEAHIVGGTKQWIRWNVAGTRGIIEVKPGSVYYTLSFAKTHAEMIDVVASSEWSADLDNEINIEGE